jgi:hypothetical protein
MGLVLALLTVTFNGLAVSLFCIICWVIWACVGSLNFARIRNEYVRSPSRQFYERKIQQLSRYEKLAVKFSPECLVPHPYSEKILNEEESFNTDYTLRHLQFVLFHVAQAIYLNLRNRVFVSSKDNFAEVLDRQVMATISSYHTVAEYLLLLSHSDDNQREAFDNRIESIIVHLQLIVSVVKQHRESESSDEPSVLMTYALSEAFAAVYTNIRGLLRNSSGKLLDQFVLFVVFPLCQWAQPPLDQLRLTALNEIREKDVLPNDFFDTYPNDNILSDQNLTVYLISLLNPTSKSVFDAFQKDLSLAVSPSDAD